MFFLLLQNKLNLAFKINCELTNDVELLVLVKWFQVLLSVCKKISSGLFKMLPSNYSFTNNIEYKQDLALNNLQRLICH